MDDWVSTIELNTLYEIVAAFSTFCMICAVVHQYILPMILIRHSDCEGVAECAVRVRKTCSRVRVAYVVALVFMLVSVFVPLAYGYRITGEMLACRITELEPPHAAEIKRARPVRFVELKTAGGNIITIETGGDYEFRRTDESMPGAGQRIGRSWSGARHSGAEGARSVADFSAVSPGTRWGDAEDVGGFAEF